ARLTAVDGTSSSTAATTSSPCVANARELTLEFLNEAEVAEYLDLTFPCHRLPSELPHLIHAKTEGRRVFMADLVLYLRDRGAIARANGEWTLSQGLPEIERELPESVKGMIERKIAQLGEEDRKLLTVANWLSEAIKWNTGSTGLR